MTDGYLMDADCIHSETWWKCEQCEQPRGGAAMILFTIKQYAKS